MKIKKSLSLLVVLSLVLTVLAAMPICVNAAGVEYSLTHGDYVRLLGRGEMLNANNRTFNWPNSGFEFEFTGKSAEVYAADVKSIDSSTEYERVYFNVVVMDAMDRIVSVNRMPVVKGWNTIYTGSNGYKKIMFVRSSEACRGTLTMSTLRTDSLPNASTPRGKLIEFIGDSYTAGFGNSRHLSSSTWYCAQNTDNWNSYTGYIARHYGADNNVIAYQGKGVYKNVESDNGDPMEQQINYAEICLKDGLPNMSTRKEWEAYKTQPQLVTVWLGTNDEGLGNATDFYTHYLAMLKNIRERYANATILCLSKKDGGFPTQVESAVAAMGGADKKIYYHAIQNFSGSNFGHPSYLEDEVIANEIIGVIDSIEGVWDVPIATDDSEICSVRADYNSSTIYVYGKSVPNDVLTLMALKPESEDYAKKNFVAAKEITCDNKGEYELPISVDKISGNYKIFLSGASQGGRIEKDVEFRTFLPQMSVTSNGTDVIALSQLAEGDEISVNISGYSFDDSFKGFAVLAQYSGGALKYAESAEHTGGLTYADALSINTTVGSGIDKIKVIYLNKTTMGPVTGSYEIK